VRWPAIGKSKVLKAHCGRCLYLIGWAEKAAWKWIRRSRRCKLHYLNFFKTFFINRPWNDISDLDHLKGARPAAALIKLSASIASTLFPSRQTEPKYKGVKAIDALLELKRTTHGGILFSI
jgi:hypothetical protein